MEPRYQSATERRELRRSIRRVLGVSHEEAPSARRTLDATRHLARLVTLATNGRYTLTLIDNTTAALTDPMDALRLAREEEVAGRG